MTTSPSQKLRNQVSTLLATEFGSAVSVRQGKLHQAYEPTTPTAAVYPLEEGENAINVNDQDTAVAVQFFLPWKKDRDPSLTVDPANLEAYAHRLRTRIYTGTHPFTGSSELWDLRLQNVVYEPDPTGHITRFTATVVAIGQNLAETTA